jgi:hypothetical protein
MWLTTRAVAIAFRDLGVEIVAISGDTFAVIAGPSIREPAGFELPMVTIS